MTSIRRVTDTFYVAPQLENEGFAKAAELGIRHIINNRPDGESPDQLSSAQAESAAKSVDVTYEHAPFQGPPSEAAIIALETALHSSAVPVLAYCRTGTRSITTWAVLQARTNAMPVEDIIRAASAAGYEIGAMKEFLRELASG